MQFILHRLQQRCASGGLPPKMPVAAESGQRMVLGLYTTYFVKEKTSDIDSGQSHLTGALVG